MRKTLLMGTALTVVCSNVAHADATLDAVLKRLDAVEQRSARLEKENGELRKRITHISDGRKASPALPVRADLPAREEKNLGNPVRHLAVAEPPAVREPGPLVSAGGKTLISKGGSPYLDNTEVILYGHGDVSFFGFNNGVYDQNFKPAISSNGSYLGVKARQRLTDYGLPGWNFLAQFESLVDVSATPTERASLGSRDSYLGLEGPYGAFKVGKSDTPYKRSTAAFDPFANTIGDYNSIISNTGGDNRAEFDYRAPHAVWYESPIVRGFQFSALFSPGQNPAYDNADFPLGEFNCSGTAPRGSGSGFYDNTLGTGAIGGFNQQCTDGSFGNLYSTALVYKDAHFTATAAYELHENVNRHGDDGLEPGVVGGQVVLPDGEAVVTGVHNEEAVKLGVGYTNENRFGIYTAYALGERIVRENAVAAFNERSQTSAYGSFTQNFGTHWSASLAYAHSFGSPGSPITGVTNDTSGTIYQFNLYNSSANLFVLGGRYRFNKYASIYLVGAQLSNGNGSHNCLGSSGLGFQLCPRDEFDNEVGGRVIRAVSTGLTFDF